MTYKFNVTNFVGELAIYLAQQGVSARQITRLRKKEGLIKLNGNVAYSNAKVKDGDEIEIAVQDVSAVAVQKSDRQADIVFEDEHFCIVNKPAGLAVIATRRYFGDSLQNALANRWGANFSFHPVNRLDKDTSGLMIVAKNPFAHDRLNLLLRQNKIEKTYLAVIEGRLDGCGIIDEPILDVKGQLKRIVSPEGKNAITQYETIKSSGRFTLLKVKLLTGRTHQIRVHLSNLGFPLAGDALYGKKSALLGRQALHAYNLKFAHPFTGQPINITAELPKDFEPLLADIYGKQPLDFKFIKFLEV